MDNQQLSPDEGKAQRLSRKGVHYKRLVVEVVYILYENCELNYPCGRCSLDCAVFINDVKIDVEYDGMYWHQDANRDRRRDYYIRSKGYKILRIKANVEIPTEQQLIDSIDYLVKDNHSFAKIELDI